MSANCRATSEPMPSLRIALTTLALAFLLPLALHAAWPLSPYTSGPGMEAVWSSAHLLPAARTKREALVHVYVARTGRWKGIFAHHSWIVIKERDAARYTRYDKVAWGRPVKIDGCAPDARWYGHRPVLVGAVEGPAAEALIPKIRGAVAHYPHNEFGGYRVWPGPNSNSFVTHVLCAIPEAGIALPPTAIGKDYRPEANFIGPTPSRTGLQLSLGGLLGLTVAWVEGVELNLLGLVVGLDLRRPAIKIPGFGRIGVATVVA